MFIWAGGRRENVLFRNPSGCALSPEEAAPYDEVWFADLCPANVDAEPAGGKPFRVFDHHFSNMLKVGSHPRCTFDLDRSGTSLMAHVLEIDDDHCQDPAYGSVTELIGALEAYDLGRFDNLAGVRLADIASSYSQEDMLTLLLENDPAEVLGSEELTQRADALAAVRNIYARRAAQYARIVTLCEGEGPGVPHDISVGIAVSPVDWKNATARAILARPGVEMAVIIDPSNQMVSLRSLEGGPDCSKIAMLYGGGGHAHAAGFKIDGQKLLHVLFAEVFG